MQKVDNLATRVNILTMFASMITDVGTHVLQKASGEGMIYLQISEMFLFVFKSFSSHVHDCYSFYFLFLQKDVFLRLLSLYIGQHWRKSVENQSRLPVAVLP